MPKLKQPPRLLTMATDFLIDMLVKYCYVCSIEGSLDKLRQHITFVKEDICLYIPWQLRANFCQRFVAQFSYGFGALGRPESHRKAVLEVLMDRKLVGLKYSDNEVIDTEDAHRIQGLQELRLYAWCHNLDSFQLRDLRVLVYYNFCTDSDLQAIGKSCPKLECLNVQFAEITDGGLLALCSCYKLRDIFFNICVKLTCKGIRDFLSAHGNIQTFYYQSWTHGADCDGFAHVGWSVYPSMKELIIDMGHVRDRDLRCITEKFPNLISLAIYGEVDDSADFSTLASLKKLSKLEVWGHFAWLELKPLLKLIGANMNTLKTGFGGGRPQSNLDFLYKFCPNIENLHYSRRTEANEEILVVPPFKRLRKFGITVSDENDRLFAGVQFGVRSKLEKLRLDRCRVTTEYIESMILDHNRFPNLTALRLSWMSRDQCDINRIEEIVKNNNLDLDIRYNS